MNPLLTGVVLTLALTPLHAATLADFAAGTLITDFTFDDPTGTSIQDTANSTSPSLGFDSDADFAGAVTNGAGQFDASGKDNTSFGSVYSDLPTSGARQVLGLAEFSWDFEETVFDPAQNEEFLFSFVNGDPRSTSITAQLTLERTSATEVSLFGDGVGPGSSNTPAITFGSSGSILTLFEVDLDAGTLELFYSEDAGATFLTTGTGGLSAGRGIESLRFVLNEDFSDDSFLVDRLAFASVPEPSSLLLIGLATVSAARRRR